MNRKYSILMFIILIILKIIDVMITCIGLSLGGRELSILGFNAFSIAFNIVIITVLGFMMYFNKDEKIDLILVFGTSILNLILIIAFVNNIIGVFNYLITI